MIFLFCRENTFGLISFFLFFLFSLSFFNTFDNCHLPRFMKGRAFDSCLIFICHTWVQPTVHGTRIIVRMRILLGTYCFCLTQKKPKIRTGVEIGKHKSLRPEKGVWGRNIYPKTIAIRLYYPNWREMTSQLQYTKLANWLLSRIFKIWAFFLFRWEIFFFSLVPFGIH